MYQRSITHKHATRIRRRTVHAEMECVFVLVERAHDAIEPTSHAIRVINAI